MHLMHLRKKIMHPIQHKLNMNHTVVMSNCYCYNQHTAQKQLRNWNLFSSKRLATKASTSHSLKDVQDICFESVLTLQIQKKNIKAKSSISLRKKILYKTFHFLVCINPLDFSFFLPCPSLEISFTCIGFPSSIFLWYLILYIIRKLYLKINSSHKLFL